MSDNNNEPDDLFSMWANESVKQERVNVTDDDNAKVNSDLTVTKKKTEMLRCYSKHILICVSVAILAVFILTIVLLCRNCSKSSKEVVKPLDLEGCWYYNENTRYEFESKGIGRMYYTKEKAFEYTYTAKDGVVYLDFELAYVTDCQYSYKVEGDTLILIGGSGTAEIGKEYVLTKLHDHSEK
jgi:hypothetical protein